jgi:hypothetical protein
MAIKLYHSDDDFSANHEINVTPFIDVMLVLLIIFMVAAPLATVDVNVDLPASKALAQPRHQTKSHPARSRQSPNRRPSRKSSHLSQPRRHHPRGKSQYRCRPNHRRNHPGGTGRPNIARHSSASRTKPRRRPTADTGTACSQCRRPRGLVRAVID